MPTPPFIELKRVTVAYAMAEQAVLQDLDLSYSPDQRIGLVGPNGSGKTTLFSVIMGLIQPQSGQVLFQGQELVKDKDFAPLRRNVGLLFQDAEDQLFSPTVLEDVAFGPLNLGLKPAQAKDRALETLEQLGLEGFADRITHRLSGGEKRLVALATILAMQPKALLLDEPTNDLDPPTRQRLIATLNELDLGYVIISHDWDFLAQTTEQSLTLDKDTGRLVKSTAVPHTHVHVHEAGDAPHEHPNGPKGHRH